MPAVGDLRYPANTDHRIDPLAATSQACRRTGPGDINVEIDIPPANPTIKIEGSVIGLESVLAIALQDALNDIEINPTDARSSFGELARAIDEEWSHRRLLAPDVSTEAIDTLLHAALAAGGLAGKVCGAGGGGCVLLLAADGKAESVQQAVKQQGMEVMDFEFAARGLSVVG